MTWKQQLTTPESMSTPLALLASPADWNDATAEAQCSMLIPIVCRNIKEVVEGRPSLLIEHVAENIAASVLTEHRGVLGIRVAVKKPHVAIPGIFRTMGQTFCLSCFSAYCTYEASSILISLSRYIASFSFDICLELVA